VSTLGKLLSSALPDQSDSTEADSDLSHLPQGWAESPVVPGCRPPLAAPVLSRIATPAHVKKIPTNGSNFPRQSIAGYDATICTKTTFAMPLWRVLNMNFRFAPEGIVISVCMHDS